MTGRKETFQTARLQEEEKEADEEEERSRFLRRTPIDYSSPAVFLLAPHPLLFNFLI